MSNALSSRGMAWSGPPTSSANRAVQCIPARLGSSAMELAPMPTTLAPNGAVCAVDHLAAEAGVAMLRAGGSAADAAVATSAVLAVTTQHMCGMGGDLFALVHRPGDETPAVLNASGRSGSGADAVRLRADGHDEM